MLVGGPYGLTPHFIARVVRSTPPCSSWKSLYSSTAPPKDSSDKTKLYANSLLLPRTTFPQWTDPSKTEVLVRKRTCDDLYRWQVRSQCNAFRSMLCTADIGLWSSGKIIKVLYSYCTMARRTQMATFIWVRHDSLFVASNISRYFQGHALNKILKDIINRYHVSLGHRVQ